MSSSKPGTGGRDISCFERLGGVGGKGSLSCLLLLDFPSSSPNISAAFLMRSSSDSDPSTLLVVGKMSSSKGEFTDGGFILGLLGKFSGIVSLVKSIFDIEGGGTDTGGGGTGRGLPKGREKDFGIINGIVKSDWPTSFGGGGVLVSVF